MDAYQSRLARRLEPFRERDMIPLVPTRFQVTAGELEMLPYVLSPDATEEGRYRYARLGRPVVRQALILREIGPEHLDPGTGLRASLRSVIRHLQFTYHHGMPVWDLQVLETHPGGLEAFRDDTERLLARATPEHRARMRRLESILVDPPSYLVRFLGEEGWIARAKRMDYATPGDEGSAFPPEFYSLVGFMEHCARKRPARASELSASRVPLYLARQLARRPRERGLLAWR